MREALFKSCKPIGNIKKRDKNCFLSSLPPECLTSPTDFDEVCAWISSEKARIKEASKLPQMYALRDEVYVARKERFHCSFSDIVECTSYTAQIAQPHTNDGDDVCEPVLRDSLQAKYYSYYVFPSLSCDRTE